MEALRYCSRISQSIRLGYIVPHSVSHKENLSIIGQQGPRDFPLSPLTPSHENHHRAHPAPTVMGSHSRVSLTCTIASISTTALSVSEMRPRAVSSVLLTAAWSSASLSCFAWWHGEINTIEFSHNSSFRTHSNITASSFVFIRYRIQ